MEIDPYIWTAVGAAAGWLAGAALGARTRVTRIEDVLVGIFGAFIGGEFVASTFLRPAPGHFSIGALACAVGGALVLLFVLRLMRNAVGPLRAGKKPTRR